jgi:oligosaccharide repeat unit polymerase
MQDFDNYYISDTDMDASYITDGVSSEYSTYRSNKSILLVLFVLLLVSCGLAFIAPAGLVRWYLWLSIVFAVSVFVLHIAYRYRFPKPRNWFTVDILFSITFLIVHFWYSFSWLIGLAPSSIVIWRDEQVVCYCAMMSVSGLIAFLIGFHMLPERFCQSSNNPIISMNLLRRWKAAGFILFLLGMIATVIYIGLFGKELFEGQYTGSARGGYLEKVLHIVMNLLLILGLVVLSISSIQLTGKYKIGVLAKGLGVAFMLFLLILGSRSIMAGYVLVLLAAYTEYRKPMSLKLIVIGMLFGFFMMSFTQIGRISPERTLKSFVETARANKEGISVDVGASELGHSVRCLHEAASITPSQYKHFKGALKISELLSIIPFANKLVHLTYPGSSTFLTWTIYGNLDSGVGTTVVADLYLDFGYGGVVILMIILGLLCKYIQQKSRGSGDMAWGVAYCSIVSVVTLMPRFTYLSLIRGVIWPLLMLLVLRKVLGLSGQRLEGQVESFDLDE